jgi:hypothetical protein
MSDGFMLLHHAATAASITNPMLDIDRAVASRAAYHRADAAIQKVVDLLAAA